MEVVLQPLGAAALSSGATVSLAMRQTRRTLKTPLRVFLASLSGTPPSAAFALPLPWRIVA